MQSAPHSAAKETASFQLPEMDATRQFGTKTKKGVEHMRGSLMGGKPMAGLPIEAVLGVVEM